MTSYSQYFFPLPWKSTLQKKQKNFGSFGISRMLLESLMENTCELCAQIKVVLFFNYKHYFSIVLLVIVDANYQFEIFDIGSYGKEGDAGASLGLAKKFKFPAPALLPYSKNILPHVILGDEAFQLHTNTYYETKSKKTSIRRSQ